jgi:predicted Zn finger-like uncharacterized protein
MLSYYRIIMIITCPKCKTRLSLPDDRIKPEGTKVKCFKCSAILLYRGKDRRRPPDEQPPAKPGAISEPPISSQSTPRQPESQTTLQQEKTSHIREKSGVHPLPGGKSPDIPLQEDPSGNTSPPVQEGPSPEDIAKAEEYQKRYGYLVPEKETIEERPFLEYLPDVFAYPFKSWGIITLVAGSIFITITLFFAAYAFWFGIIGYVFVGGLLSYYMMKIVFHSAEGELDLPGWDVEDWWDDIVCPVFQLILVTVVAYAPLFLYLIISIFTGGPSLIIVIPLLIFGTVFQPMGILSMSLHHSFASLNPAILIPAIFKIPLDYAVACGMLFLIFILKAFFTYLLVIPFVGPFIDNFVMIYLLVVEMRILGLMYYANKDKLGWF